MSTAQQDAWVRLDRELSGLKQQSAVAARLHVQQERLSAWLRQAEWLKVQSYRRYLRLLQLSVWVPQSVWLTGVEEAESAETTMRISGNSHTFIGVSELIAQIQSHFTVHRVSLETLGSVADGGHGNQVHFSLRVELKP